MLQFDPYDEIIIAKHRIETLEENQSALVDEINYMGRLLEQQHTTILQLLEQLSDK